MKSYFKLLLCAALVMAMPAMRADDEKKSWVRRAADISLATADIVGDPALLALALTSANLMGYAVDISQVVDIFAKVTMARGLIEIMRLMSGGEQNETRLKQLGTASLSSALMNLTLRSSQQSCGKAVASALLQCRNYCWVS